MVYNRNGLINNINMKKIILSLLLIFNILTVFSQTKLEDLEKRILELEKLAYQKLDALALDCPAPISGNTITQHARHRTLAADSTNVCRFWINDVPVYPTDIQAGSNISITGSYAGGWTIANTYSYEEQVGVGKLWFTNTAPTGYLLCQGQAVSRTTYAALFAIIGTTYGVGDGSTTFNLPNLQQRFPLGKAVSGTGSTLAGTGGSIDHVHIVDPPNTSTSTPIGDTVAATPLLGSASGSSHTHNVDISQFNSGANNPPYLVVNFIIKY